MTEFKRLVASTDEKEEAGKVLDAILFNGIDDENMGIWIHDYLEDRSPRAEMILAADSDSDSSELSHSLLPRTLVDLFGSEIFEATMGYKLRDKILEKLFENNKFQTIFNIFLGATNANADSIQNLKVRFSNDRKGEAEKCLRILTNHQKTPWMPGGAYANRFVDQLRIPRIFAGIRSDPSRPRVVEAIPKADLKDLKNFQENMKNQVVEILEGSDEKRAIITLPTGGGKTRVAVEAIVEYLNNYGVDRNILWIAQSKEVCEQAVVCFKQVWEVKGKGGNLNIFRAWGVNDIPTSDERGIIVGGIQKLSSRKKELQNLIDNDALSAVFIDEAHHSTADSYVKVLNGLKISSFPDGLQKNDERIPLIGLTATPERRNDSETIKLRRMYGEKRIFPSDKYQPDSESVYHFGDEWKDLGFMRKKLIELKYLATPEFHGIEPGVKTVKLSPTETKDLEEGGDEWMKTIAAETERNKNIKDEILKWANQDKKILYFGTNLTQSITMAKILEKEGIASACITGNTRYATRKLYIDIFNEPNSNDMQVMCNYNVLSTGFDSPQIDTVIIARPTTSVVSYQQMVGRGLRGELFGGKPGNRCDIVTVKDNITKFNDVRVDLGYAQYERELEQGPTIPAIGETFTEDELYEIFRVQKYGEIRFTHKHNYVVLIDSDRSNYQDSVGEKYVTYIGTGEKNQGFDKGIGKFNAKVRDPNSILLYFQKPESNKIIFKHLVKYDSHSPDIAKNKLGKPRKVIKFKLKIIKK